ncbi:MAG: VWA domain-containing protein [Lachnospiraceae bacterium]|nr:VWA domain-containing protein [Lachnospiraceae bacterium]
MKKRNIAVFMCIAMLLSACGNEAGAATERGRAPVTSGGEVVEATPTPSFTDQEIEARIKSVGEQYDGLYSNDQSAYGMQGAFMNAAPAMTEEVCEAEDFAVTGNNSVSVWNGPMAPMEDVEWNTEGYNAVKESGFVSVGTQPFSTFGADVDTAVYSNFRRSVYQDDGYGISGDAIRLEEMINYFNYDYALPQDGDKFGVVTSLTSCPWNADTMLLRVGVRAEEILPEKGSNIVFLIDTSGSMFSNNKLPLVQSAFKILQEQLTDQDTVSIVTYAGTETVLLEGVKGDEHKKIETALDSLQAGGSTNGEGGIKKAYEIAEKYFIEGGNNRVILATDGDLNVGVSSESGLIELVEEEKETGVFLSCLGFGEGNYQDDKMEALADYGNGNYAFVDCSREAERVLKDEIWSTLYTVAKDVKFQVEFNPALVKGYRLVGYENRKMAAEDFADDTKDGGEVGSGQCVTVLYEVVTADSAYEIPEVASRYGNQSDTAADGASDELLTVNIRYKEPDADVSKLLEYPVTMAQYTDVMDDDTSWAAGIAQFGMLLRDSEFKGTSSYDEIYDRLKQSPKVMSDDLRAEFLYMLQKVSDN